MTPAEIIRTYLSAVRDVHATGAASPETSYYPALSNLMNAVGDALKPKVRCVMNLKNFGNGMPDGGLFTADQLRKSVDVALAAGQKPARGAIEVKGAKATLDVLAKSDQVAGYLQTYGIVLITNLRQFAIVDANGIREQFSLSDSADDFWATVAAHPPGSAERVGPFFAEFLARACLHDAPLTTPKDVAWFLASYARDALARVERRKELPALAAVRTALEQSLGMTFTGDDGEHFFRSTLVQTLFYGVFSAWVKWCEDAPPISAAFDWHAAAWTLHVPFIRSLYGMVAQPATLGPLGLVEPIDWAAAALNRVQRGEFFRRFERSHAVQYFYEPFLEAYDPQLRKDLGVWYTPPEVVKYQVARVDRVLREELGLEGGLAHKDVVVLDPCCGTGAYLVEVLRTIGATLKANGGDALSAADLKTAATSRVFGFEIMPAPFVVAHLQLGLLLQAEGTPLDLERNERVGVYLTNALTGWESLPTGAVQGLIGDDLTVEREQAEHVKRDREILVILGNPPYNAFAGTSPAEERGLVEPYKVGLVERWGVTRNYLDDLYVRFFRLAERRIAEMSGLGVVSFISNFSYLTEPSYVVMRERFTEEFDRLWFDNLNGDSRRTGKITPDGQPDPSVFSTDFNKQGIKKGTAICALVRKAERSANPVVGYRDLWGSTKRADLLASLQTPAFGDLYRNAFPNEQNRYSFVPDTSARDYLEWPSITDFTASSGLLGLNENRGGALFDIDEAGLSRRMQAYHDSTVSTSDYMKHSPTLTTPMASFDPPAVRNRVLGESSFNKQNVLQFCVRPFDIRFCYWTPVPGVWNRSRPSLRRLVNAAMPFVVTRPSGVASPEGTPFFYTRLLSEMDTIRGHSYHFPPRQFSSQSGLFTSGTQANLSATARSYLTSMSVPDPDTDARVASLIWMHVLAIGYAPAYLSENADGIRRDWPRIPLPATRAALEVSAALGERVAALLDTEADVAGVTAGAVSPLLRSVAAITKAGGGSIDPNGDDLALTVNWGYAGQKGVTMPGRGRTVARPFTAAEQQAIATEAASAGQTVDAVAALLGGGTLDVYLNDAVYWSNVPVAVWDFYIGGYQVLKKWLSYRERPLLGRPLRVEEAREVTAMARRLCGLVLLRPALDANYTAVAADTYAWTAGPTE